MIGKKAEEILNRAVREAYQGRHEYLTLEHVFYALLSSNAVRDAISACGGDPEKLEKEIEAYLSEKLPKRQELKEGETATDPAIQHPMATLGIQRLMQRAIFHVQSAGKEEVRPEDLLVAFFQAKDSYALYLLRKQGVERLAVLQHLSHGARKEEEPTDGEETESRGKRLGKGGEGDALETFTVNLVKQAKEGKIDPLIGRENELSRMIQTLCRRTKNNPLLVGEAGVGKTALAEGLALRIARDEVPEPLKNAEVYSLDMGTLIAGAKFRGDFEQRLKRVLKALQSRKASGKLPIVFIDEIHTIIGAGAVSGGTLDAANLLKPLLSKGELRCIGSTTYGEYRAVFEKDHALARRFQKIDVPEPSQEEAIAILKGLQSRYEEHHSVRYSAEAIRAAVELSSKHLTERFLPDKAIDVIDEAGAKLRLRAPKEGANGVQTVDLGMIEDTIAQIARVPARSVQKADKSRLKTLEQDLKLTLFGQDHAIESVSTAIRLARSGLRTGEKPVGSFLFCGPTGVGKTELAKQLAHFLGISFHRFDMSEYGEKHTVSRLIGAPPGYVGFEQAGLLTEAVRKNPHAVVLLDEVEKAHPDVWNLLLQVMDHGTLTDNNGKKADFRNVILILTSNVGSREMERRSMGMGPESEKAGSPKKEIERVFTPEFRNRLDAIVYFNPLTAPVISQVVSKLLMELESQLLQKGVEIEISEEAKGWLAEKGYDRLLGARPMARVIQEEVKRKLADEILFGKLEGGGRAKVELVDGSLVIEIESMRLPPPRKQVLENEGQSG